MVKKEGKAQERKKKRLRSVTFNLLEEKQEQKRRRARGGDVPRRCLDAGMLLCLERERER